MCKNVYNISDIPNQLLQRFNGLYFARGKSYPEEMRKFALTLNFLSSRAYEYVRDTFNDALPHRSTLSKWYSHINGEPGICEEALEGIKYIISQAKSQGKRRPIAALMFDEMSIRRHIDFDGRRNWGFVDLGIVGCEADENTPVAGHALVYMVVCLNASWKLPVAYYLVNSLTGDERASITLAILEKLSEIELQVISLTCDGPAVYLNMAKQMGASFDVENFQTQLNNPFSEIPLHFMLDACHCAKLVRNALFDCEEFYDLHGQVKHSD